MSVEPTMAGRDEETDGLEELRAEVMSDPVARAAYEDSNRRTRMLAAMPRIRQSEGLKQHHVADAMHTTQSAVSEIESGRADPRLRTLQRYARAIRRRLDIAMVDEDLPVYDEGMANGLWRLVEQKSLSPLLTGLITQTGSRGLSLDALADLAHLPPEIVRPILSSLQERGWVTSAGHGEVYALSDEAGYIIGISLHRESVRGVLLDLRNRIIKRMTIPLESSTRSAVVETTVDLVGELYAQRDGREILGVGVSIAGPVEIDTGTVRFAPDLKSDADHWTGVELEGELQSAVQKAVDDPNLLVAIENDANALALFEYLRRGQRSVAVVLLSESGAGIGSGFVVDSHPIYGDGYLAGEGGHIVLDGDGEPCRSGFDHKGCLETVATAEAILRQLELPSDTADQVRKNLAVANDRVRRGEQSAIDAFHEAGTALGRYLAVTMITLDPSQLVVYGHGELVNASDYPSGSWFRRGITGAMQGGLAKGDELVNRLEFRELADDTNAVAAGAAAMRGFLYEPAHWRPSVLISRTHG